jgi:hypothetical protein
MADRNLRQLITAAELLRPLLSELVFVGGAVTGLLITDEAGSEPRTTLDVDTIAEITSYAAYVHFGDRLRTLGFLEDTSYDAPLCRWVHQRTIVDVMPLDEKILGFSNRWYRPAMRKAILQRLLDKLEIRMVTAPYFVATKMEAYKGRGDEDVFGSRDLEDIVSVVDGRATIVGEVQAESADLRSYIRSEIGHLLSTSGFVDALPGYLLPDAVSQTRLSIVLQRLRELAAV